MYWTVGKCDDVTGAAAGAVGVVWALVPPETGEVGVGVAIEAEGVVGIEDEAVLGGSEEVSGDALESELVGPLGVEGVAGALVDSEGNVRTAVARQVEEHADDAGVVDEAGGWGAVRVLRERGLVGGGTGGSGHLLVDTAGVDDFLGEAGLGQSGLVAASSNVDAKETFGSIFLSELEVVVLKVGDKGGDEGLVGRPDE